MADYAMNWRLDTAFDKLRQRPRQQRLARSVLAG